MAEKPKPELEDAPSVPGQITNVNPLELIWEKHRIPILLVAGALIIAVALNYGLGYWQRKERDRVWGRFAEATQLRALYAPEGAPFFSPLNPRAWASVNKIHWDQELSDLHGDLDSVSEGELEDAIKSLEGTPAALWSEWLLACKQAAAGEDAAARSTIESLAAKSPDFATLHKQAYPPIYVPLPEKKRSKDKTSKDEDEGHYEENRPPEPPASSLSKVLLERADRDHKFRENRSDLYVPPEPDAKPEVVFVTSEGDIKIRFYKDRAPKHVANFITKCSTGWYKDRYFAKMMRKSREAQPMPFAPTSVPELLFIGYLQSKDQDRTKWDINWHSEGTVPFENSGLSHFPFMVAADRDPGKRDSDNKVIYFTANDAAKERDNRYVVFGRIVEGQQIVKKIIEGNFFSTSEETSGQGKPDLEVKVNEVKVIE